MEAITTNTIAAASHLTALANAALSLDAGSVFVLTVTLLVFCGPLFFIFPPFPPRKSDAIDETHDKLGVDPAKSNLLRRKGDHDLTAATAEIKSLFVYPVKSCKGIELTRAKVVPTGLEHDRLFTFAQLKSPFPVSTQPATDDDLDTTAQAPESTWEFITQRQFPLLATIQTELWQPSLPKIAGFRDLAAGASHEVFLLLRFPDPRAGRWAHFAAMCVAGSLRARAAIEILLPVSAPDAAECARKGYTRETVRVWGTEAPAVNLGSELPPELARYLGVSNRLALFRVDPEGLLRKAGGNAPPSDEAGYQPVVGFADSYPVSVMNLASVRDLEGKVAKDQDLSELSPRRFRANIFVSGSPAYDEDDWKKIKFASLKEKPDKSGEATFHVSCRTTRCKLPNVNQDTGVRHSVEPDKTLRATRAIDKGAPKKGCLGMQMTPLFENKDAKEFHVEVGMPTKVLERGEHMVV